MKKPIYICFEGVEGSFKTTNAKKLADFLTANGYSVLLTKEPGTHHIPLTMKLRELMLSNEYADVITPIARELISQAIRSIHIERLIVDADYDYIIQDRGTLSGKSYAEALGHSKAFVDLLSMKVTSPYSDKGWNIYDKIVLMINDPEKGLKIAKNAKEEFKGGDAMESMGPSFMRKILDSMIFKTCGETNVAYVFVDSKTEDEVFADVLEQVSDSISTI